MANDDHEHPAAIETDDSSDNLEGFNSATNLCVAEATNVAPSLQETSASSLQKPKSLCVAALDGHRRPSEITVNVNCSPMAQPPSASPNLDNIPWKLLSKRQVRLGPNPQTCSCWMPVKSIARILSRNPGKTQSQGRAALLLNLAKSAEKAYTQLPAQEARLADRFEATMLQMAQSATLSQVAIAECAALPIGQKAQAVYSEMVHTFKEIPSDTNDIDRLDIIVSKARSAAEELVQLTEEHLAEVVNAVQAGESLEGLLPRTGVKELIVPQPNVYDVAHCGCALVMYLSMSLGSVCSTSFKLATRISRKALKLQDIDEEQMQKIASKARAVQREIRLLKGSHTNMMMHPLELLLQILKPQAVRP